MANESVDCQAECTGDPSQECGSDASDDFLSLHQREALGSPQGSNSTLTIVLTRAFY